MTTVETIINIKGAQVMTLPGQSTVREAVRLLNQNRIGAVVVSDDGTALNGIFAERDVVRQLAGRRADVDVRRAQQHGRHGHAHLRRPRRTAGRLRRVAGG